MRAAPGGLLLVLIASACGGASATAPSSPSSLSLPSAPNASRLASDYVNEVVSVMQANSLNRDRIDWTDFRAQVVQRARGAQSIIETFPAISLALGLLDDHHSFYSGVSGGGLGNPGGRHCAASAASTPELPPDIGYVKIGEFSGTVPGADRMFADSVQQQIRTADSADLTGWIVDLRGNGGGNMWPMVAGVGPVLGDGIAGYFVPPTGAPTSWSYQNGASVSGATLAGATSTTYLLIRPAPRVAVLTDSLVASSGEAVAISFRGRPNARSFGGATCGLSTANQAYRLSDGGTLNLTVAVMADRNRTTYGGSLPPDELIGGDVEVVQRAIAWLRSS
jgi:peptidase S41-like protein